MISLYLPKDSANTIFDIDYNKLKGNKITTLIFDLDYTILPYKVSILDEKTKSFLLNLKNDFRVLILSNSPKKRLDKVFLNQGLEYYYRAYKPSVKKVEKKVNNIDYLNSCFIGDQLFTDIKFANKTKCYSILIKMDAKLHFSQKYLARPIDNIIKHFLKRKYKEEYVRIFNG
jgi:HAD superfamily phosphatase (TIGR01668 family)